MRDPSIDKKMHDLGNIYHMFCKTSGDTKAMWEQKWYDLVKQIAAEIRQLRQK